MRPDAGSGSAGDDEPHRETRRVGSEELTAGLVLGDYEIIAVAGTGGMGVVYRANQRSLNRVVALKVIRHDIASSGGYRERFLREARLAASVDHPHVVSVYDVGEQDGRLFLAMQWVDGLNLRTLIDGEGALAPDRAVTIAEQLAGALEAVHDAGLIHRDVKPANVLLRQMGDRDHAYLMDFGVAKAPKGEVEDLTQTGSVIGTSGYLAPEQIMGQEADARSDLYAMACLTFELMTGKPAFSAANEMALRWAHANSPRPQASLARPALGARYDGFFVQALSVDPRDRFQSGRAFAAALRSAQASMDISPVAIGAAQSQFAQTAVEPEAPATVQGSPPQPPRRPATPLPPATPEPPTRVLHVEGPRPPEQPRQPADATRRHRRRRVLLALAAAGIAGVGVGALAASGALSKGNAADNSSAGVAWLSGPARSGQGATTSPATQPSTTAPATQPSSTAPATQPSRASSAAVIIGVLDSYQAAYSAANVAGLGSLFTEGVERHGLAAGGCATVRGKSSVLAQYRSQFTGGPLTYRLVGLSPTEITFTSATEALVHTNYAISGSSNTGPVSFWLADHGSMWLISRIVATCHPS
jgi:serine/threonine protein kinase